MKKMNCVLLVDDNDADNFFHQLVIEKLNITDTIEIAENGEEALQFLKKEDNCIPELIFLDINMPRMNGWEFLDEYKKIDDERKSSIIIIMLTTSVNPDDLERAKQISEVSGFEIKPLTAAMLENLIKKYFGDEKKGE